MDLIASSSSHQFANMLGSNARTRQQLNAAGGALNQLSNLTRSGQRRLAAAGCENSCRTQVDQCPEGKVLSRHDIKGTMEDQFATGKSPYDFLPKHGVNRVIR